MSLGLERPTSPHSASSSLLWWLRLHVVSLLLAAALILKLPFPLQSAPSHPTMTAELIVQGPGEQGHQPQPSAAQENPLQTNQGSVRWRIPKSAEQFHPILVNFTAALLPLAFLSDILGRVFHRDNFHAAGFWMVLYAAVITPFTALAGWWWKGTVGPELPARIIAVHQWLGTVIGLLFILLAVWRWRIYKRGLRPNLTYFVFALIVIVALVYQGSLGGAMAF